MHTDSSASRTYFASRSASEWTTTVLMPSSRQARWMRSAISPRLAIRILSNSWFGVLATIGDDAGTQRAAIVSAISDDDSGWPYSTGWPFSTRIALTTPALSDSISFISFIASMMQSVSPSCDGVADLDERLGARRGRAIERADHRALDEVALGLRRAAGAAGDRAGGAARGRRRRGCATCARMTVVRGAGRRRRG